MTVDEIRDLIDSTITTNGVKNITGQALNLALNEIVNAVAEAATTGGGAKTLYVGSDTAPLTEEQIASNVALYNEISTALSNGEIPPQVNGIAYIADLGGNIALWSDLIYMQNGNVMIVSAYVLALILASDGSVTVQIRG